MFHIKQPIQDISRFLNTLNIIFYLLVAIPLTIFCILYLHFEGQGGLRVTTEKSFNFLFHVLIPAATFISLGFGYVDYRKQLKQEHRDAALSDKLYFFYRKSIFKYILLSIANLLPLIGLYFTGEQLFAALYTVALVAFSFNRPTLLRIFKDLKLNKNEKDKLTHSQYFNES